MASSRSTSRAAAAAPAAPKKRKRYANCLYCNVKFEKKRRTHKFCCDEHRQTWHDSGGPSFAKFEAMLNTRLRKFENATEKRLHTHGRAMVTRVLEMLKAAGVKEDLRKQIRDQALSDAMNCTCHIDPLGRCVIHPPEAATV